MKIDRGRVDDAMRSSMTAVAAMRDGQTAAASFASVLQQHRQGELTRHPGPRRSDGTHSRHTAARRAVRTDAHGRVPGRPLETPLEAVPEAPGDLPRSYSTRFTHNDFFSPTPTGAAGAREARRRRFADELPAAPCIEIAHARTGARFRLSRENGVWVLAFQARSTTHPIDLHSLLDALRTHFATHGLGPLDLIVNES